MDFEHSQTEEVEILKKKVRNLEYDLQAMSMAKEVYETRLREAVNEKFEIREYELRMAQIDVLKIFEKMFDVYEIAESTSNGSNMIHISRAVYESMLYFVKFEVNRLLKTEYYENIDVPFETERKDS